MTKKKFTVSDGSLLCINEAQEVVATITTFQVYILVTLKRVFTACVVKSQQTNVIQKKTTGVGITRTN